MNKTVQSGIPEDCYPHTQKLPAGSTCWPSFLSPESSLLVNSTLPIHIQDWTSTYQKLHSPPGYTSPLAGTSPDSVPRSGNPASVPHLTRMYRYRQGDHFHPVEGLRCLPCLHIIRCWSACAHKIKDCRDCLFGYGRISCSRYLPVQRKGPVIIPPVNSGFRFPLACIRTGERQVTADCHNIAVTIMVKSGKDTASSLLLRFIRFPYFPFVQTGFVTPMALSSFFITNSIL